MYNHSTSSTQAVPCSGHAVASVDLKKEAPIKAHADVVRPEYQEFSESLREVRFSNTTTRFVSTQRRLEKR